MVTYYKLAIHSLATIPANTFKSLDNLNHCMVRATKYLKNQETYVRVRMKLAEKEITSCLSINCS
jgi:hypothetical protein